ncbi:hypothetical protein V6S02_04470 [Microbacterium sp. CCNWLW134]|uniref:ApeA N-terminal domain 1-containing protein n=1 Tax=Microbacterium sp. CCNWLW134 TaxID=3122064 RepID=UPI00300FFA33
MSTMRSRMPLGTKMAGLVADQTEGAPWLSGELTIGAIEGIHLEIPFVHSPDGEQFEAARRWFREKSGPPHLAFQAPGHSVGLYGCTYTWGSIGTGASVVRVHAKAAVLRASLEVDERLRAIGVTSLIDGLQEWTRLSSVSVRVDADAHHSSGPRASINVAAKPGPSWRDRTLELSLSTRWLIPQGRSPLSIHDDVALRSVAEHAMPIDQHLDAHRTIRDLVSLVFGAPCHYRGHELTHPDFVPTAFAPPEDPDAPRALAAEFFHHTTIADEAAPQPESHAFLNPIIQFDEVGASGLEGWTATCRRSPRAVALTVGLLRRQPVIEDLLVNSCMAIEALGRTLTSSEGEEHTLNRGNPTFTTYAFRCLDRAGFTADTFGVPLHRVARAVGRRYADTKHPNTTELPDSMETLVVAQIAFLAMRVCLVTFASSTGSIMDRRGINRDIAYCSSRASGLGIDLARLLG